MARYKLTLRRWFYADEYIEIEADTLAAAKDAGRRIDADETENAFGDLWPDRTVVVEARRVKEDE
jgi:elongation factor P--beta-lysine ligase